MTWEPGRDQIKAALTTGELQQVIGGQAAGEGWLAAARTKIATAELIADADPESAYVTAYDAARSALVGVLAHQGLRATQKGGHLGVEHAVHAQFGQNFAAYGTLRRRRAELEYPAYPAKGSSRPNSPQLSRPRNTSSTPPRSSSPISRSTPPDTRPAA